MQVSQPNVLSEIDLDLVAAQQTIEQLKLTGDKPQLSDKALNRVCRRSRIAGSPAPPGSRSSPPTAAGNGNGGGTEAMSLSMEKVPTGTVFLVLSSPQSYDKVPNFSVGQNVSVVDGLKCLKLMEIANFLYSLIK